MTNVIKFPNKRVETVDIEDENTLNKKALEFAYEMIDYIHDGIHEETGDCIFTDDEYMPMVICMAEVIASTYMLSQGHEHPFQEIAQDLFGDIDIDAEMDYDETSNESDEDE
jgi:hypothetical protein